jgi:DnaJ domain
MTSSPGRRPSQLPRSDLDGARIRLGLDAGALPDDVRAAFQRYALEHHPDRGGDAEAFRLGVEAYRLLSQPPARASNVVFFTRQRSWRGLLRRVRPRFRLRR